MSSDAAAAPAHSRRKSIYIMNGQQTTASQESLDDFASPGGTPATTEGGDESDNEEADEDEEPAASGQSEKTKDKALDAVAEGEEESPQPGDPDPTSPDEEEFVPRDLDAERLAQQQALAAAAATSADSTPPASVAEGTPALAAAPRDVGLGFSHMPAAQAILASHDVRRTDSSDSTMPTLLSALRAQISELATQVTSLNSKLVQSYDRIGDLEDDAHEKEAQKNVLSKRVIDLEKDKKKWESEIERGGWVEKDDVQGEMQRLMVKVIEETKTRETAVLARNTLETEIDDLTSSLFKEANRMVAVERLARARAEEKMKALEEHDGDMIGMMESLQATLIEKMGLLDEREKELDTYKTKLREVGVEVPALSGSPKEEGEPAVSGAAIFSDGAHFQGNGVASTSVAMRSSTSIAAVGGTAGAPTSPTMASGPMLPIQLGTAGVLPYHEFLAFVTYLRKLRTAVLSRPQDHSATGVMTAYGSAFTGASPGPSPTTPGPPRPSASSTGSSLPLQTPAQLLAPHLLLSSHAGQAFIKRCMEEDSDPCLRLDIAPGLGFLSRGNVRTAITDGTLVIEPTYSGSILPSANCAMCGTGLEKWWDGEIEKPQTVQAVTKGVGNMRKVFGTNGWGFGGAAPTAEQQQAGHTHAGMPASAPAGQSNFSFPVLAHQQVHIFRVSEKTGSTRYAICPKYCLPRLRAVCEFWTYLRILERGLLLEDLGFKFLSNNGPPKLPERKTPKLGVGALGGGKSVDSLQATKSVESLSPPRQEVAETGEEVKDLDAKSAAGDDDKDVFEDAQNGSRAADLPLANPSTEALSRPMTPSLSADAPPRPKRSAARPATPQPSHSATMDAAPGSPQIEATPSSPSAPKLPPRHPAARSLTPAQSAGAPPSLPPRKPESADLLRKGSSSNLDDVTGWEDRCWLEVVRHKEALFWTRLNATVAPGYAAMAREMSRSSSGHQHALEGREVPVPTRPMTLEQRVEGFH